MMKKYIKLTKKHWMIEWWQDEKRIFISRTVTGKAVVSGEEAKANAVEHIVKAVRWTEEESAIAAFAENFTDDWRLLEVGPGKTLCGLWRDSGFGDKAERLPVGTLELGIQKNQIWKNCFLRKVV